MAKGIERIVQFSRFGGPEVLEFVEVETPTPGDDEVLVRVKALGLNRAEALSRRNEYIIEAELPAKLGTEAAGVVEAVGRNITHVRIGDAVNIVPAFFMGHYAIYGEAVAVAGQAVVKQPPSLSFEEGASLWTMFLTPYGALIEDAKIQPGEAVLITAASSSTGIGAIQLANMVGAIPIAITRTSAKRQQLLDAGARHVVAFEEADLVGDIMAFTDGKGARVAFDPVGGELLPKLIGAMPWKGTIYSYGWLAGDTITIPIREQLSHMLAIKGWAILDTLFDAERLAAAVEFITRGLGEGKLAPSIDRVFAFDDIVEAHRYLETGDQVGKLVVKVG